MIYFTMPNCSWVRAINERGITVVEGVPCEPGMVIKVRVRNQLYWSVYVVSLCTARVSVF